MARDTPACSLACERLAVLEALRHTPPWVFGVLIALVAFGLLETRDRTRRRGTLFVLPLAMVVLSMLALGNFFGLSALPFVVWASAFAAVFALSMRAKPPTDIRYDAATRTYRVPGSWLPLALMMAIFSIRYAVGYSLGRELAFAHEAWFVAGVSAALGVFSGLFAARAERIRRSAQ